MFAVKASVRVTVVLLWLCSASTAQNVGSVGTRAQGMGGAFVGVADDAAAVYWNPAGLASGAYFSLLLDGVGSESIPENATSAGRAASWLVAITTPALGVSYYRVSTTTLDMSTDATPQPYVLDSLVTHHVGATLVQSLSDRLAVGATIKLVRGLAASAEVPVGDPEDVLSAWDLLGRSGHKVDLDVGLMATGALGRIGITVRNVTEPGFRTGGDTRLTLERQIRGGASIALLPAWIVAADADLTRNRGLFGDIRELAFGTEGRVTRRLTARGGIRLNTAGDVGRTPALSAGASLGIIGAVVMDAQVTGGSDKAFKGWGIAGRVVF